MLANWMFFWPEDEAGQNAGTNFKGKFKPEVDPIIDDSRASEDYWDTRKKYLENYKEEPKIEESASPREEKIDKLEPIRNNYVNSKSDENLLIKAFDSMQQLLIKKEPVVKIKHDDIDISATPNKYSARAIMLLLLDIF